MKVYKKIPERRGKMLFLFLIIILIIITYIQNKKINIKTYNIETNKVLNSYKILQIADLHNNFKNNKNYLLKKIKNINPDIIVFTGDEIDGNKDFETLNLDNDITLFTLIKELNYPMYYVYGNHEQSLSEKNLKYLANKLEQYNVKILNDKSEEFKELKLVGLNNKYDSRKITFTLSDLTKDNNGKYVTLLTHRPELFGSIYSKFPIDTILCGHTHGGQFKLPIVGGLYAPNQGLFPKYDSGRFKENECQMIVSSGLGNSSFPIRIMNSPELVIIDIYPK